MTNIIVPPELLEKHPCLSKWAILTAFRGSIAHGMYIPPSEPNSSDDIDLISICIPPIDHYFGLKSFGSRGTKEIVENQWDIVSYELHKTFRMLKQGNPNIMSLLWLNPEHYIHISSFGQMLIDNRSLFVGKHIYNSFIGYAKSQMKRMTTKNFTNCYEGNKRQALRDRFGYDTKHASHTIRLLTMAIEFLATGEFKVFRDEDRKYLLDIKRGEYSFEYITLTAANLIQQADDLLEYHCDLPDNPDEQAINDLSVRMLTEYFSLQGD